MHFIIIYSRDAHPADSSRPGRYSIDEDGNPVYQSETYEERLKLARKVVEEENIEITVLVDEIDNQVWCTYGPAPNNAFLIGEDGIIIEKQGWYQPELMEAALNDYFTEETAVEF